MQKVPVLSGMFKPPLPPPLPLRDLNLSLDPAGSLLDDDASVAMGGK
jgi:hypothetical protein